MKGFENLITIVALEWEVALVDKVIEKSVVIRYLQKRAQQMLQFFSQSFHYVFDL